MANTALVLCASCSRHVRSGSQTCPFCSAVLEHELARTAELTVRSTRAAVLAATAMLGLSGCDTGLIATAHAETVEPTAYAPQYGAPPEFYNRPPRGELRPVPPMPAQDAGTDAGTEAAVPDAAPVRR